MLTFMRRRGYSELSVVPMASLIGAAVMQSGDEVPHGTERLVRWGCVGRTGGFPLSKQINPSTSIISVSDKIKGRRLYAEYAPPTLFSDGSGEYFRGEGILRPGVHSEGSDMFRTDVFDVGLTIDENHSVFMGRDWYLSKLIDKKDEYRVLVFQGRVAQVIKKRPIDRNELAWGNDFFDNVMWSSWPMEVVNVALGSMSKIEGLTFGAVDVIVDHQDKAYVCEINTSPYMEPPAGREVSYTQGCFAKCFKWIMEHEYDTSVFPLMEMNNWRESIHPAIQEY